MAVPYLLLAKWVGIPTALIIAQQVGEEIDEARGWDWFGLNSEQKENLVAGGVTDQSGRIIPGGVTGAPVPDPQNPTLGRRTFSPEREAIPPGLLHGAHPSLQRKDEAGKATDPAYRGSISDPILQGTYQKYVRQGDIFEEYKALSQEEKERLALALFLGDEDAPEGFMSNLLIESIDDIYRPHNVALAMQLAIDQAATAYRAGTVEEEELIPTLRDRFTGFTDEDVNRAAERILARSADKLTSKAELEAKFKAVYGRETGRTPSQKVIQAFVKGIHSREEEGETVDPYEVAALATETAEEVSPGMVKFQKTLRAVSKINELSSRLA
jgi:hypothetical protein